MVGRRHGQHAQKSQTNIHAEQKSHLRGPWSAVLLKRRAREEDEKPARRSVGASRLLDGLDCESDRDLVADHRAPGLHW
jgi:hypothetical protein